MAVLTEKTCGQCKRVLPTAAFSIRRASRLDGLMPLCKECQKQKHVGYRAEYAARHALVHPRTVTLEKRCRACGDTKPSAEFSLDRERKDGLHDACRPCLAARRKTRHARRTTAEKRAVVLARFSLTVADYDEMLAAQGGGCAICGTTEPAGRWNNYFAVDHSHTTGEVRGLLCGHCNVMLGNAKDDPSVLRAGASYLERGL